MQHVLSTNHKSVYAAAYPALHKTHYNKKQLLLIPGIPGIQCAEALSSIGIDHSAVEDE